MKQIIRILLLLPSTTLLSACLSLPAVDLPEPLRPPAPVKAEPSALETASAEKPVTVIRRTPSIPPLKTAAGQLEPADLVEPDEPGELTVTLESVSLPAFINEVYGHLLGYSFQIDQKLQKRKDLVTLRISNPLTRPGLRELADQVLLSYGVAVQEQGDLLHFVLATGKKDAVGEIPLMFSGRTLPYVPATSRPIFHLVPLESVRNVQVAGWLKMAYRGQDLKIQEDAARNAILLIGPPSVVRQALEAIRLLDQPFMRGRYSMRIEPAYWSADALARELENLLQIEGYGASTQLPNGSLMLMPLSQINSVLVFSASQELLEHVRRWAVELDQPKRAHDQIGLFFYPVRNTSAEDMAETLRPLLSAIARKVDQAKGKVTAATGAKGPGAERLVVDRIRNALVFSGTGLEWANLRPVMQAMDQPAKQVLVEVTIAEINLTDTEEFGIEWLINEIGVGDNTLSVGVQGLGLGSAGLGIRLTGSDSLAVLNAFATNSNVTILSSPRLMVRNGEEGTIDVGTEVPVLTSQSTTDQNQGGDSAILQTIEYRNTGVLLRVRPVIHAGRRIDLDVSQEVSEAQENNLSNISSPKILNRKVKTSLSLNDGGAVLLGGLISSSGSKGTTGVPLLKDLPLLGWAFRSDKVSAERTELVILITPYIIENAAEAEAITREFRNLLSFGDQVFSKILPDKRQAE